ncbi:hypothetical protein [Paenibacillus pinihumi]|uniref:hypothetical protein n=1 Tax=Paenibacillus pinihumi TaxID=669462 RepID=UPI00048C4A7D|nr:hypothetical protein [Paenibacillus pinihumi]
MMKVSIIRVGDVWKTEASGTPAEVAELIRIVNDKPSSNRGLTMVEDGDVPICIRKITLDQASCEEIVEVSVWSGTEYVVNRVHRNLNQ